MVLSKAVYLNPYLYNFANLLLNARLRKSERHYTQHSYSELSQYITLRLSNLLSNGSTFFPYFTDNIYVITISLYYPIILPAYLHKSIQHNIRYKVAVVRERQIEPFYFVKIIGIGLFVTLFIIYNKLRRYQILFKFLQCPSNSRVCHQLCQPVYQSTNSAMAIWIQRVKLHNIIGFSHYFLSLISWLGMMLKKRHFWRDGIVSLKKQIITLKVVKENVGNFHYLL